MSEAQQTIDYDLENFKHLKYLKDNLYPTLNQALEIVKSQAKTLNSFVFLAYGTSD